MYCIRPVNLVVAAWSQTGPARMACHAGKQFKRGKSEIAQTAGLCILSLSGRIAGSSPLLAAHHNGSTAAEACAQSRQCKAHLQAFPVGLKLLKGLGLHLLPYKTRRGLCAFENSSANSEQTGRSCQLEQPAKRAPRGVHSVRQSRGSWKPLCKACARPTSTT